MYKRIDFGDLYPLKPISSLEEKNRTSSSMEETKTEVTWPEMKFTSNDIYWKPVTPELLFLQNELTINSRDKSSMSLEKFLQLLKIVFAKYKFDEEKMKKIKTFKKSFIKTYQEKSTKKFTKKVKKKVSRKQ
jgi:hypothetical protein